MCLQKGNIKDGSNIVLSYKYRSKHTRSEFTLINQWRPLHCFGLQNWRCGMPCRAMNFKGSLPLLISIRLTRLGELLHFGQNFKVRGNNYFAQIDNTFQAFFKLSKSFILLAKSFWATFLDIWRLFTGHTDQCPQSDIFKVSYR